MSFVASLVSFFSTSLSALLLHFRRSALLLLRRTTLLLLRCTVLHLPFLRGFSVQSASANSNALEKWVRTQIRPADTNWANFGVVEWRNGKFIPIVSAARSRVYVSSCRMALFFVISTLACFRRYLLFDDNLIVSGLIFIIVLNALTFWR